MSVMFLLCSFLYIFSFGIKFLKKKPRLGSTQHPTPLMVSQHRESLMMLNTPQCVQQICTNRLNTEQIIMRKHV